MKKVRYLAVLAAITVITATAFALTACPQDGGVWPDNEFTKLLPEKPANFIIVSEGVKDGKWECTLLFDDVTKDDVKAFVNAAKQKGFTHDVDSDDDGASYDFSGYNADDYEFSVDFTAGKKFKISVRAP